MTNEQELQLWKKEMERCCDWNIGIVRRTNEQKQQSFAIFADDVNISILAIQNWMNELRGMHIPRHSNSKKIVAALQDSMKERIKHFQLEVKYFQAIKQGSLAGRFGSGAIAFAATRADELLKNASKLVNEITAVQNNLRSGFWMGFPCLRNTS